MAPTPAKKTTVTKKTAPAKSPAAKTTKRTKAAPALGEHVYEEDEPSTATPRIPKNRLRTTDLEGVYRTVDGRNVDAYGVDLDFKALKKRDDARFVEVLGAPLASPADLLKAVAMDPRNTMERRIDAAHKAAPYFNPKLVAVQGVLGGAPIMTQSLSDMSSEQLEAYHAALKAAASIAGSTGG